MNKRRELFVHEYSDRNRLINFMKWYNYLTMDCLLHHPFSDAGTTEAE